MAAPRPARRTWTRARAGFTIVEIMVVVVILGLLAGLTTMSWHRILPREEFIAEVRALSERIRECRAQAISRNAEYWLYYDLDANTYWISTPYTLGGELAAYARSGDDKTGAADDGLAAEDRARIQERSLGKSIDLVSLTIDSVNHADGKWFVRFTPLGTSSEHWIVLKQEATQSITTIEVQGLTGLISFHDGVWDREPANDNDFN